MSRELQFILGRAKSGKSHYMYERIIGESQANPGTNYVFIVPEQVNLLTQQEIIKVHPNHSLFGVDVLSFKKLALRVFDELGIKIPTVLDDVGKSMLLRKTLLSVNDQLTIYRGSSRKPGFIDGIKSMLDEFSQYNVSEQVLELAAENLSENVQLSAKLHDLLIISRAFNETLSQTYITAENLMPELAACAHSSDYLKKTVLIFDGFSDLTPVQYRVMDELLRVCPKVYVVLDMTKEQMGIGGRGNALFHLPKTIIDDLTEMAAKAGMEVLKPCWLSEDVDYYKSSEIRFLERSYEQNSNAYSAQTKDIFVMEAEKPEDEVERVCGQILALTQSEGMRYRDMAIITTNPGTYGEILEKKLQQAGIPFFSDNRHSLMGNVGVEAVLSAILCTEENFSYESVFRYLKCGLFSDLSLIDLMENYCIAAGLRGRARYEKKWEWKPRFITDEDLERLNGEKGKLLEPLFKLNTGIKESKNVSNRLNAIRSFLSDISFNERMEEMEDELNQMGETELSREYAQVCLYMERLLNQMDELMGDEKLSLKELCDCLETSFASLSAGAIPSTVDNIVIADIRRSRLENVSVVFVIGMNDGVFPAKKGGVSVLSDIDREKLLEKDVKLAPTAKKESFVDKLYIYRAFTKPKSRLYLSYSRQGSDGKSLRPSYVLGQIKRIFPNLTHVSEGERIYHVRQGLEVLARESAASGPLRDFYEGSPKYTPMLDMIDRGKNIGMKDVKISGDTAEKLFGSPAVTSVTRLEKFAECEMAHFLRYGLVLNERQEHELRSLEMGNIYHEALDAIFREAKEEGIDIKKLDDTSDEIERLAEYGMDKAMEYFSSDLFESSAKNEYIQEHMREVLKLNLEAIAGHLGAGEYETVNTEMTFGPRETDEHPPLEIENSPFLLNGKIDRLDEAIAEDGTAYVRVIDYKTGEEKFDETKLANGLQLQTMLYLLAVSREKNAHPAGGFYYIVDEPVVEMELSDLEESSDEEIKKKVHKKQIEELKLTGKLNVDGESLKLFTKNLPSDVKTQHILAGLRLTKDGIPYKNAPVVSEEKMNEFMNTAKEQTVKLGEGILNGDIDTNPYMYGDKKACTFCPYKQICGFDTSFPGYQYRRIEKESAIKNEEVSGHGSQLDRESAEDN